MGADDPSERDRSILEALRAERRELQQRVHLVEGLSDGPKARSVVGRLDQDLFRLILAELVESAARVNREWELASRSEAKGDVEAAMAHLAIAYTQLDGILPKSGR